MHSFMHACLDTRFSYTYVYPPPQAPAPRWHRRRWPVVARAAPSPKAGALAHRGSGGPRPQGGGGGPLHFRRPQAPRCQPKFDHQNTRPPGYHGFQADKISQGRRQKCKAVMVPWLRRGSALIGAPTVPSTRCQLLGAKCISPSFW